MTRSILIALMLALSVQARAADALSGQGSAADSLHEDPLRLSDLIRELVIANPELQAARRQYDAARARALRQSTFPDPRITAGWVSSGLPYPGAGLGTAPMSSIGIQVAQPFPYPGKRALMQAIGEREADASASAIRAMELRLVAQLKESFYELGFTYEAEDLIAHNRAVLEQLAGAAEARYAAGSAAQQDIIKAGIELSALETKLIALRRERLRLEAQINALLDRPPDSRLGRPEPVSDLPPLEPAESLAARALETSPLLRRERDTIDGRQLALQSAAKAYYPDFEIMGGYYNQGAMSPMWEFKITVSVPIQRRPALEEANSLLAEARRSYRSAHQTLLLRLRERRLEAETARELIDLYSQRILPQAELAFESALASYRTGGVDFLTVLANLGTIVEYRLAREEQRAKYLRAVAGLEELSGGPDS